MADPLDNVVTMMAEAIALWREEMKTATPRRARKLARLIAKNEVSLAKLRSVTPEARAYWADIIARSPVTKETDDEPG